MENCIELVQVEAIDGNYLTVNFVHTELPGVEEVMTLQDNLAGGVMPEVGADVLLAFDSAGDMYCLGVVTSNNQPLPNPGDETATYGMGGISLKLKADGTVSFNNPKGELIAAVNALIALIGQVQVPNMLMMEALTALTGIPASTIGEEADMLPVPGTFTLESLVAASFEE